MVCMEVILRSYDDQIDRARVEDLERRCEVGPAERVFQLYTDTLGDPICRIRNSPMYKMLVAEMDKELVGVIQGSVKIVTVYNKKLVKVGYVLGLRVVPIHRRKGIGLSLVKKLEEWFISSDVEYAYMATENDNEASVNLFVNELRYVKFRTPVILVNPVNNTRPIHVPSRNIEIVKLKVEDAELMYRRFMASTDFFPDDIGNILRNKLSLGTWVAYDRQKGQSWSEEHKPRSWAMVSVWNSGELFKLRLGKAPLSCLIYTKSSRLIDKFLPWFKVIPSMPDFFNPFGFYFIYGVHREGPVSGKLVKALCQFVHNMAMETKDCKVIVTEVGGNDSVRFHIPHWKLLSCPEDLWCLKALRNEDHTTALHELTKTQETTKALFVDPREV